MMKKKMMMINKYDKDIDGDDHDWLPYLDNKAIPC
jgi:hypothetical protein